MGDTQNPYAPPTAAEPFSYSPSALGAYRDNNLLVVSKEFESPNRCIISGVEIPTEQKPKKLLLTYINPLAFILIIIGLRFLIGLLPVIIALLFFQKKLKIQVYYEKVLRRKKQTRTGVACLSLILSLVSILCAMAMKKDYLNYVAVVFIIISITFAIMSSKIPSIRAKKVKNKLFFVRGVHPDFLNQFPPLPPELLSKKEQPN